MWSWYWSPVLILRVSFPFFGCCLCVYVYVAFLSDVMDSLCFLLLPQFSYINLSGTDGLKYIITVGQGYLWGMRQKKNWLSSSHMSVNFSGKLELNIILCHFRRQTASAHISSMTVIKRSDTIEFCWLRKSCEYLNTFSFFFWGRENNIYSFPSACSFLKTGKVESTKSMWARKYHVLAHCFFHSKIESKGGYKNSNLNYEISHLVV